MAFRSRYVVVSKGSVAFKNIDEPVIAARKILRYCITRLNGHLYHRYRNIVAGWTSHAFGRSSENFYGCAGFLPHWHVPAFQILITRSSHLVHLRQIYPKLQRMGSHPFGGHFIMLNPAACRHPLHVPRPEHPAFPAVGVVMFNLSRDHIRYRLHSAVRVDVEGSLLELVLHHQQKRIMLRPISRFKHRASRMDRTHPV
ncbi:hypothetical protein D3C75_836040 [compost metagenome]